MRSKIHFCLAVILAAVAIVSAGQASFAQAPATSPIPVVPIPVSADWNVYQDVNGAWWLKYPASWTVSQSYPGGVEFQIDRTNTVQIKVQPESFALPYDDWLTLELLAQGTVQSLALDGKDFKIVEMGRWFRGVFGLYFVLQGSDPQTGETFNVTVVMTSFAGNQTARAIFSSSSTEDKDIIGAVLSSLTAGAAPAGRTRPPVQQLQQGEGVTGVQTGFGGQQGGMPGATGPFGPIVFAENVDTQNRPVNPRTSFPSGVRQVYGVFDYDGVPSEAQYTAQWYMNGVMVFSETYAWDLPATGSGASVLLSNSSGFPDGQYKLELIMGGQIVQQGTFSVGGAPVEPGPVLSPMPSALPTPIQLTMPTPIAITIPTPEPPLPPTPESLPPPTPEPPPPQGRSSKGKIVYTQFDGDVPSLWTINVDGSGDTRIKGADHASDPSWSPDGSSIVFVGWDGGARGGSGIYTMNPDGSNVKLIWNQGQASYLDWSLPGRYVAVTSVVAGTGGRRIIIYDGKESKWTDIGPGEQASFSPDATRVVAKSCIGGDCGLYIMNRDGGNKWRLTTGGDDAMPAWSPKGDRIAYSSQRDGNWDIWVVNVDGSGNTRITSDPGIDAVPVWLPDGSGIAFRSSRGGSWGIWVMDPDGSNPVRIVESFAGNDWGRARLDVR